MINRFFTRHSFTIIILVVFFLPVLTRGVRMAMTSNDNKVEDWLPQEYPETQDLRWFKQHFENETFILISWEGCTVDDPRLELLETKLQTHVNLIYPKPATLIQAGIQKLFPPAQPPEPIVGPPLLPERRDRPHHAQTADRWHRQSQRGRGAAPPGGIVRRQRGSSTKLRHRHADSPKPSATCATRSTACTSSASTNWPCPANGSNWAARRSITSPSAPRAKKRWPDCSARPASSAWPWPTGACAAPG